MVRSFGSIEAALPENPIWLEFPRSDADSARWPTETKMVIRDGEVNWYREVEEVESKNINWRRVVACAVANKMGKPGT
jgi:hypothetical protein